MNNNSPSRLTRANKIAVTIWLLFIVIIILLAPCITIADSYGNVGDNSHYDRMQGNNSSAILSINKEIIDYGYVLSTQTFIITNIGDMDLNWNANENPDESWIALIGTNSGLLAPGERIIIRVDISRQQLPAGSNYGEIRIQSNGGNAVVDVIVEVGSYPTQPIFYYYPHVIDFFTSLESRTFIIKNRGSGTLDWSASLEQNVDWIQTIIPSSGSLTSMMESVVTVTIDRNFADAGFNTATIELQSNTGNEQLIVELMNGDAPKEIRANVGGADFRTSGGKLFSSDRPYIPGAWGHVRGHPYTTDAQIKNTNDDYLYQTELFWLDGYRFNIPNGSYTVILHFCELYYFYVGGRLFDVYIENERMLDKLDIFAEAGMATALTFSFDHISVSDGRLDIDFEHWLAHAKLSAIEVIAEQISAPQIVVDPYQLDFGHDQLSMNCIIKNVGNEILDWNIDKTLNDTWIMSIEPKHGSVLPGEEQLVTITIDRSDYVNGEYTEHITITSNGGNPTVDLRMEVKEPVDYTTRVNCGDPNEYVDSNGVIWNADKPYSVGSWGYIRGYEYHTTDPISFTNDAPLYQSERWGMTEYRFDLDNGFYEINLHFAEIYFHNDHLRVFQVDVEKSRMLSGFDIYHEIGHDRALVKTCVVEVLDGQLNIEFLFGIEYPKISAIEILPIPNEPLLSVSKTRLDFGLQKNILTFNLQNSGTGILEWEKTGQSNVSWLNSIEPSMGSLGMGEQQEIAVTVNRENLQPGMYEGTISISSNAGNANIFISLEVEGTNFYSQRVNCGSDVDYVDGSGNIWNADRMYSNGGWGFAQGHIYESLSPIANTEDDYLYQTERWDMDSYKFDLMDGFYEVKLLFAEIYFKTSGKRSFHVEIENEQVLSNYDIFRDVGHDRAIVKTFIVLVSDGQLNI